MTISTNDQKVDTKRFEANFDKIFGEPKTKVERGSFIQDPDTGELVPRGTYGGPSNRAPGVIPPMKEFVSPIDGSVITTSRQLNAHNAKHGVTNSADYSPSFLQRAEEKRVRSGERDVKQSRITDIQKAMYHHEHNR